MCFSSAVCVYEKRKRRAQFPSLFRYLTPVYLSALLPQATKASESYCAFLYTEHRFFFTKKTLRSTLYALPFIFLLTLSSFSDLGFPKIKKLYTLCTRAFSLSSYLNPCNKNYKLLCYLIYFYYYSCVILYFFSIICIILINFYFYLLYF